MTIRNPRKQEIILIIRKPGDQEEDRLPTSSYQNHGLGSPPGFLVSLLQDWIQVRLRVYPLELQELLKYEEARRPGKESTSSFLISELRSCLSSWIPGFLMTRL